MKTTYNIASREILEKDWVLQMTQNQLTSFNIERIMTERIETESTYQSQQFTIFINVDKFKVK